MPADLRSVLRGGASSGRPRILPLAVALSLGVVLAAAIGGTSHFGGPRWYPHVHASLGQHTGTILVPTQKVGGGFHVPKRGGSLPVWVTVAAVVLIVLVVAALVWRWWSGRRLPPAPTLGGATLPGMTAQPVTPEPDPEPEKLLTGIELALTVLDEERDPADAVVRAWLGLQETAEESGIVRRPAETPTEFTSRILSGAFTDDRALRTLLRLYLRTRFGDHPVTAEDVVEVREALQQLLSTWQRTAVARTR